MANTEDYYTASEIDQKLVALKIEMMEDINSAIVMNEGTAPDPKKTQMYLEIKETDYEY